MSSPEFDPQASATTQTPSARAPLSSETAATAADAAAKPSRNRFRTRKSAEAKAAAPLQAAEAEPAYGDTSKVAATELPSPTPIQPMPETFYSRETIQQPMLASRAAYLHTAPPNYPAATPYQPSPAHQAAPPYVNQSARQTWPAIDNPLPRDESAPFRTAEADQGQTDPAEGAGKRFRLRMPQIPSLDQVRQSIPQVDTSGVAWKRLGIIAAAMLVLMLLIPTLYVAADRAPGAAVTENPERSALQTLRENVWNLVTLGRGGVANDTGANPAVSGQVEVNALQAAYNAAVQAADAQIASGQPVVIGLAPDTIVRNVALVPYIAGAPVIGLQAAAPVVAPQAPVQVVSMAAPVIRNVEAVPLCRVKHRVRPGEGLFPIADAYGVERRAVYRANTWVRNRPNMYLYVGDIVCIP